MSASEFVGFRCHRVRDKDILDALENAKDRTKEIKKLLRRGLNGNPVSMVQSEPELVIDWKPTFQQAEPASIAGNILSGFE